MQEWMAAYKAHDFNSVPGIANARERPQLLMPMMKCLAHYAWLLGRVRCDPEQHRMARALLLPCLQPRCRGSSLS